MTKPKDNDEHTVAKREPHNMNIDLDLSTRFPVEITAQIIKLVLPTPPPLPPPEGKNDPRLCLTQICQTWREVAFSIPTLWNVCLDRVPTSGTIDLITSWLDQSSSTQICLWGTEDLESPGEGDEHAEIKDYITGTLLAKHSSRVRELFMFPFVRHRLGTLRLDALTTLSLDCSPGDDPGDPVVAPLLRRVGLRDIFPPRDVQFLDDIPKLPWEQLEVLSFEGYINLALLHGILLRCTSLKSLHINRISWDSSSVPQTTLLDLPYLEELYVDIYEASIFHRISMFNTPRLTSLTTNHPPDTPGLLHNFTSFLGKMKATLRRLELMFTMGNDINAPIEIIMHAIPLITHLSAKGQHIPPAIISKIGKGELLPLVEVLHIGPDNGGFWRPTVNLLIPDETQRTSQLREIHIYSSAASPNSPQRLEELNAYGINVYLEYPEYPTRMEKDPEWILRAGGDG